jgi:dipeptidyl aminopeptidase/acylaminoacyl peptidase
MRADGRDQRQVTRLDGYATFPDFSPDGHQLVFTLVTANGSTDLWTIGVDGRNPRPLTTTPNLPEDNAAWSPDGRRLVFLRGGPLPTTDRSSAADDFAPTWSPDGRRLAFLRLQPAARSPRPPSTAVTSAPFCSPEAASTPPRGNPAASWPPTALNVVFGMVSYLRVGVRGSSAAAIRAAAAGEP